MRKVVNVFLLIAKFTRILFCLTLVKQISVINKKYSY